MAYVEQFIQTYDLDEKQRTSAKSAILQDHLEDAKKYRESHKAEFEKVEANLRSIEKSDKAAERLDNLRKEKAKLEEPIHKMFERMDQRLKGLLNEKQRGAADPEKLKILDALYQELTGKREARLTPTTGPKPRPEPQRSTTQPEATQAASSQPAASQSAQDKPKETGPKPVPATQPAGQGPRDGPTSPARPTAPRNVTPPKPPAPEGKPADKPKIPDPPEKESGKPPEDKQ